MDNITMETTHIAPDMRISRVLSGMWQVADIERKDGALDTRHAAAAMLPYVQAGLTTFDMADHYGTSELIAGDFYQHYAEGKQAQYFTKWVPKPGPITRAEVRQAVGERLQRLKHNCLDLLQFHVWNYADPSWLDCLFWLDECRQEGMIRHLGLTNVDAAHLHMAIASGIPIRTNQISYSVLDSRAATDMTKICAENNVGILAYGTLAGGFLTEKWLGQVEPDWQALPTWSLLKYGRFIGAAGGWDRLQYLLRTLQGIAQRYQVSIANIACRYILQQPAVAGIIIGARLGQRAHIQDNLKLCTFTLDAESLAEIKSAQDDCQRIPGNCGDEYRKPPFLTASGDLSHHLDEMPAPYHVEKDAMQTMRVRSGTAWEDMAGYCRAVRRGNRVWISGTTATHNARVIGGQDMQAQLHFIIDKIEGALQSLGGSLADVVRTRLYVKNIDDWQAAARVHGARFAEILPSNTLVQAQLVGDDYLVEMEAEAELIAGTDRSTQ